MSFHCFLPGFVHLNKRVLNLNFRIQRWLYELLKMCLPKPESTSWSFIDVNY